MFCDVTHGRHSSDSWCCPNEALNSLTLYIKSATDGNDGVRTKILRIQWKHEEIQWIDRHNGTKRCGIGPRASLHARKHEKSGIGAGAAKKV